MFGFARKKPSFAVPDLEWLQKEDESIRHSPDLWKLESYQCQLLFVPDEMMRHHHQHDLIEGHCFPIEKPLPAGFTRDNFSLWKKKLGKESQAIPLKLQFPNQGVTQTAIKGQLFPVLPYRFKIIDIYKENRYKFLRQRVSILAPCAPILKGHRENFANEINKKFGITQKEIVRGPAEVRAIRAWMYIGVPEYWNEMIDAGRTFSPVGRFTSEGTFVKSLGIEDYYYFSHMEYRD